MMKKNSVFTLLCRPYKTKVHPELRHIRTTACFQKAFTLIELLVVVLIIGILAAIAVPQYEKTVEKAKATQALTLLKSAYQAAEAYYMANGEYPKSFSEMGFDVPWTGTTQWLGGTQDTKANLEWSLQLYNDWKSKKQFGLYVGRISGKYKGAGFVWMRDAEQTNDIFCVERINYGITFDTNLSAGAYCVKIMNGTSSPKYADSFRRYALP